MIEGTGREEVGLFWREERSDGVGARRRIFFRWKGARGRSGKGGARRPGLGVMRSFWFWGGIERWVWIIVEREVRVEKGGRVKVWDVPWWVIVMVMGGSSGGSWEVEGSMVSTMMDGERGVA